MLRPAEFSEDHPIIVGLTGKAGTGKTSTALELLEGGRSQNIVYDHLTQALPLYEFATIRTKITGFDARNRQLWQINDLLKEIMGNQIAYEDFVELVYDIYSEPIITDGKPRTFLQNVGSMCRSRIDDCLAKWATNKVTERFELNKKFYSEDKVQVFIISDVRFINEAQNIKSRPNSFIIKLAADDTVVDSRLFTRDGFTLSASEKAHPSELEQETDEFKQYVDWEIDTSQYSIEEVADLIHEAILELTKEEVYG